MIWNTIPSSCIVSAVLFAEADLHFTLDHIRPVSYTHLDVYKRQAQCGTYILHATDTYAVDAKRKKRAVLFENGKDIGKFDIGGFFFGRIRDIALLCPVIVLSLIHILRGQLRHAAGLKPYSLHVRAGMAAQEKC